MSYHDTVRAMKIISTVSLGQFAGAATYIVMAVQPSLIEQPDVTNSSKTMASVLSRSYIMPICALASAGSSLAVYLKTRGTPLEDPYWLVSGGLMLSLLPYTVALIGPINMQFREEGEKFTGDDEKWSDLLSNWHTFHTPRAVLSMTLFAVGVCRIIC